MVYQISILVFVQSSLLPIHYALALPSKQQGRAESGVGTFPFARHRYLSTLSALSAKRLPEMAQQNLQAICWRVVRVILREIVELAAGLPSTDSRTEPSTVWGVAASRVGLSLATSCFINGEFWISGDIVKHQYLKCKFLFVCSRLSALTRVSLLGSLNMVFVTKGKMWIVNNI